MTSPTIPPTRSSTPTTIAMTRYVASRRPVESPVALLEAALDGDAVTGTGDDEAVATTSVNEVEAIGDAEYEDGW